MLEFVPPPIRTKNDFGRVDLVPSFRVTLALEERVVEQTPRGARIHQRVVGGAIRGPRLAGIVFAHGGGEFGLIRPDLVEELFTRFMIRADNGEWLYAQLVGYRRTDGYARCQATFDADVQGPHAWLNQSMFVGALDEKRDHTERTATLFEAA